GAGPPRGGRDRPHAFRGAGTRRTVAARGAARGGGARTLRRGARGPGRGPPWSKSDRLGGPGGALARRRRDTVYSEIPAALRLIRPRRQSGRDGDADRRSRGGHGRHRSARARGRLEISRGWDGGSGDLLLREGVAGPGRRGS